jgi:hypothetical protein
MKEKKQQKKYRSDDDDHNDSKKKSKEKRSEHDDHHDSKHHSSSNGSSSDRKRSKVVEDESMNRSRSDKQHSSSANGHHHRREADALEDSEHVREVKRLRTYDTTNPIMHDARKKSDQTSNDATTTKQSEQQRVRTRSFDTKEEASVSASTDQQVLNTTEWRQMHNITIRHHGNHVDSANIAEPFREFNDTPFDTIIKQSFQRAGFAKPTPIQSQVCLFVCFHIHTLVVVSCCLFVLFIHFLRSNRNFYFIDKMCFFITSSSTTSQLFLLKRSYFLSHPPLVFVTHGKGMANCNSKT